MREIYSKGITAAAAAVVVAVVIAFPQSTSAESNNCVDNIKEYVTHHAEWLKKYALDAKTNAAIDLVIDGKHLVVGGRTLDLSIDDPQGRPHPCEAISGEFSRSVNLAFGYLKGVNLDGMNLHNANLRYANLRDARLTGADLSSAELDNAWLSRAELVGANLLSTNLRGAWLDGANMDSARLGFVVLSSAQVQHAIYSPDPSMSPSWQITDIRGLRLVRFDKGKEFGIVALRKKLKSWGLRRLEREATHAIERNRANHDGVWGVVKWILFGVPTGWGLWPWGALVGFVGLIIVFTFVYKGAIRRQIMSRRGRESGIFRVRLSEYLDIADGDVAVGQEPCVSLLYPKRARWIWTWALYFAVLAGFHIGWREIQAATWISRLQTREFDLRALGWVRCVSGLQAILSVYLIVIWALTYFGRPFE